jgi:hypothetical protein
LSASLTSPTSSNVLQPPLTSYNLLNLPHLPHLHKPLLF